MGVKRIINKEDYPMVTPEGWDIYEKTTTLLPCKCDDCGCIVKKSIDRLDSAKSCLCKKCADRRGSKKNRRVINKDDYPMVIPEGWDIYINIETELPCKCLECGCIVLRSISKIDSRGGPYCKICAHKITIEKTRRIINRDDYPMVSDWSGYKTTITKLPCKCDNCGCNVKKSIKDLDDSEKSCLCQECRVFKRNESKHRNGTFGTSKTEEKSYKILCELYGESNIKRNWNKDSRYPFLVDFYIISKDLFIECNFFWTHGKTHEPFNEKNPKHIEILNDWKSKPGKFYKTAINVWTIRDPLKIRTAKENNLNYKVFYNIKDFLNEYKISA